MKHKRCILLLTAVLLFSLCGCGQAADEQVTYETGGSVNLEGWYNFQGDCIPDTETAVAVGSAVIEGWQRQGVFKGYVLKSCTWYEDSLCWVLRFAPEQDLPGAEAYVKIMQANGETELRVAE